uniref:Alpha-tocopherol transfer protein isoform x1 n=1 Tax=Triatoma infestans TaxID=30076 RepID=A0A171B1T8_TRIIF
MLIHYLTTEIHFIQQYKTHGVSCK